MDHEVEPPIYEHSDRMTDLDIEEAKMKAAEQRSLDRQLALHVDPRDAAYSQEPEREPNLPPIRGTRSARGDAFWAARAARRG